MQHTVYKHFKILLLHLLSFVSFFLTSLTSFSSKPMNVLVIRLVTVLLIDSSVYRFADFKSTHALFIIFICFFQILDSI